MRQIAKPNPSNNKLPAQVLFDRIEWDAMHASRFAVEPKLMVRESKCAARTTRESTRRSTVVQNEK